MKIKDVYVIFKTHLDVGYTDYAKNIVDRYLNTFIPNAIRVGYELKESATPFIWTVGSWLIDQALKKDPDGSVAHAVEDGILNWHGLPFTTHTELMNPAMLQYGLEISGRLDQRFGKKTTAAKMTDVPGHTIGMVPFLNRAGIRFLHIGVNPDTPVPTVFRWKCNADEVTVMYDDSYGGITEIGDFAVYFAHTNDNLGPQNAEEIIAVYEAAAKSYPGAQIHAATLNDIAERICALEGLPVVEEEIGDTWIYGAASDPEKISRYRKIQRYIARNGCSAADLTGNALLVPEHTWGMAGQTFFPDTRHYSLTEFEGETKSGVPGEQRRAIEKSWEEQRGYVKEAEQLLDITPDYPVRKPPLDSYSP